MNDKVRVFVNWFVEKPSILIISGQFDFFKFFWKLIFKSRALLNFFTFFSKLISEINFQKNAKKFKNALLLKINFQKNLKKSNWPFHCSLLFSETHIRCHLNLQIFRDERVVPQLLASASSFLPATVSRTCLRHQLIT